jgi:hypothetical protein
MTQLPTRELERTEDSRSKTPRDQVVAAITNPHMIVIVIFFLIGCLIAANLILHFPDVGQTAEPFNQLVGP